MYITIVHVHRSEYRSFDISMTIPSCLKIWYTSALKRPRETALGS